MNKLLLTYLILINVLLFTACRGPVAKENETLAEVNPDTASGGMSEKYSIDVKESVVTYKGSMSFSSTNAHIGYVYVSKGELILVNDKLAGGTVQVDMNTIADKDHGSDNNLVAHLKSADFFDVEKFPITSLIITRIASALGDTLQVTGNLTIKGITHSVTFPVKTEVKDGTLQANGNLIIDRTQWDVRYKSGKFYDNLANEAISDNIEFEMKIIAKK